MVNTYSYILDRPMLEIFQAVYSRAIANGDKETALAAISIPHSAFYASARSIKGQVVMTDKETYETITKLIAIYKSEKYISLKEM